MINRNDIKYDTRLKTESLIINTETIKFTNEVYKNVQRKALLLNDDRHAGRMTEKWKSMSYTNDST